MRVRNKVTSLPGCLYFADVRGSEVTASPFFKYLFIDFFHSVSEYSLRAYTRQSTAWRKSYVSDLKNNVFGVTVMYLDRVQCDEWSNVRSVQKCSRIPWEEASMFSRRRKSKTWAHS